MARVHLEMEETLKLFESLGNIYLVFFNANRVFKSLEFDLMELLKLIRERKVVEELDKEENRRLKLKVRRQMDHHCFEEGCSWE